MIKLFHPDPEATGGVINEQLLALTQENATLKAEIERLKKEAELLQVDYANKLATQKVDFETKEIELKKQIRDLRASLELRNSNERQIQTKKKIISPNQLWDEAVNSSK